MRILNPKRYGILTGSIPFWFSSWKFGNDNEKPTSCWSDGSEVTSSTSTCYHRENVRILNPKRYGILTGSIPFWFSSWKFGNDNEKSTSCWSDGSEVTSSTSTCYHRENVRILNPKRYGILTGSIPFWFSSWKFGNDNDESTRWSDGSEVRSSTSTFYDGEAFRIPNPNGMECSGAAFGLKHFAFGDDASTCWSDGFEVTIRHFSMSVSMIGLQVTKEAFGFICIIGKPGVWNHHQHAVVPSLGQVSWGDRKFCCWYLWQPVPKMSLLRHPSPSSARLRASHAVPSVFNGAGTNLVVAQAFWPRAGIIPFDPYHEFCEETEVRCKL